MLSDLNILILDEPGNHLDVDTVESLADALTNYEGTVIFTSHDRHFTKTVASSIIEVRDSRVTIYSGQYDNYLYKVNKEIEAGERELASQKAKIPQAVAKPAKTEVAAPKNVDRDPAKEIKLVEKISPSLMLKSEALILSCPR